MPRTALALYLAYAALAFGYRSFAQWRRTGSTGFRGFRGPVGSPEFLGGALFVAAVIGLFFAPILSIREMDPPLSPLDSLPLHAAGLALAGAGAAATLYAQFAMGNSWRVGVNPDERTRLVTNGPFAIVRNPIFASMIPTCAGAMLLVGNVSAIASFAALVAAIELQVRFVEEPYLLKTHGDEYRRYSACVGRFVPGLGRIRG